MAYISESLGHTSLVWILLKQKNVGKTLSY